MTGTVILGPRPPEVAAFIERRRRLGLDGHDEVWEGVYHVVPHAHVRHARVESELTVLLHACATRLGLTLTTAFNLGDDDTSFRVPDLGVFRAPPDALYVPTAAIVVEVLSPDDATFAKFDYYAAHGVEEILVADPETRTIRCWHLDGDGYIERDRSEVLGVEAAALVNDVNWP